MIPHPVNRGLPGPLPKGERVLWQGSPDWRAMARCMFHLRGLAIYFGVALAYYAVHTYATGTALLETALGTAEFAGVALVPIAVLALYAWGTQKATVYTITNRRVVIRMGIAMPMTLNLPFARIDGASFRPAADGTGDLVLQLGKGDRLAYLIMWPHARPWRMAKSEPMLRCLPQGARVAQVLSRALAASADMSVAAIPQLQGEGETATIGPNRTHAAAAA